MHKFPEEEPTIEQMQFLVTQIRGGHRWVRLGVRDWAGVANSIGRGDALKLDAPGAGRHETC